MYHTSERPLEIEMIRSMDDAYLKRKKKAGKFWEIPDKDPGKNLFTIHTANHWMDKEKNTPAPKMLFGELWYQGELCIMFADTNVGKSILAVQIGNALAGRDPIAPFSPEVMPCKVAYIDFELSAKQFQSRYTHNEVTYGFNKNFYRAEFNPSADMPYDFKTYDDYMNAAIESVILRTEAPVVIIDNITCLRSGTERASQALPLMKHLKALKTKLGLSILVLAHTPKRNPAKPISRNDLQGSKMLINFCDSAFAIGQSHRESNLRYIKQVKQRNSGEVYGAANVCLFRITKPLNFISYQFEGYAAEAAHLYNSTVRDKELLAAQIGQLSAQGLSQRQIAAELGVSLSAVHNSLKAGRQGSTEEAR